MKINLDRYIMTNNWFNRKHCNDILGAHLSPDDFAEFKKWVENTDIYDTGEAILEKLWQNYQAVK